MNSQSEAVTEIIESVRPGLIAPDPALVRGEALRRRRVRQTSWRVGALAMVVLVGVGVFVARGPLSSEPVQIVDVVDEPDVADIEPAVDLSGPPFAPEAEFSLTGTWSPVVLRADGEAIDLVFLPDAELNVQGRSFSSSDGCNTIGGGRVLWQSEGRIELIPGDSTGVGCQPDRGSASFDAAIRTATSWGVTEDGQLVLVGQSTYVRFEQIATEAFTTIDRTWRVAGIVKGLAGRDDVEVGENFNEVLLTIDGTDGKLESIDCDAALTFSIEADANRSEGFFRAVGVDPSGCDPQSFAYRTASFLAVSDYYLSIDGFLRVWEGSIPRMILGPNS